MPIRLNNIRLAFPDIFEPKPFKGQGDPYYTCKLIIHPTKQAAMIQQIKTEMLNRAKEKWGTKAEANFKALMSTDKVCLKDGNTLGETAGFADMVYLSLRNDVSRKPKIYDQDGVTPLVASSGRLYSGCYVNADVGIWVQDNEFGKRINARLRGVQFYKDGDAFTGDTPMKDGDFEDVSNFGEGEPEVSETSLL